MDQISERTMADAHVRGSLRKLSQGTSSLHSVRPNCLFAMANEHWCKEMIGQGTTGAALKLTELRGRWQASDLSHRKQLYRDEVVLVQ